MHRSITCTPRALFFLAVLTFVLISSQLASQSNYVDFDDYLPSQERLLNSVGLTILKDQNDQVSQDQVNSTISQDQVNSTIISDQPVNTTIILDEPVDTTINTYIEPSQRPTIARVYMQYGQGFWEDDLLLDELYNQTLENHLAYDRTHGYGSFMLTTDIYDGIWNKVVYLASIIATELIKPEEERLQWLCWTDTDTILMNPALPIETFLPPDDFDEVDLIVAEDWNEMNAGVFMIRVSRWSLRYMSDAIAYRDFHEDEDLGWAEQDAMVRLLEAHKDYREKAAFVPMHFFNGYHDHRNDDGSVSDDAEVSDWDFRQGDLMIHFAGPGKKQMLPIYMNIAMQHDPAWEMPLEETNLPQEIEEFWEKERTKRDERRQQEEEEAEKEAPREEEEEETEENDEEKEDNEENENEEEKEYAEEEEQDAGEQHQEENEEEKTDEEQKTNDEEKEDDEEEFDVDVVYVYEDGSQAMDLVKEDTDGLEKSESNEVKGR